MKKFERTISRKIKSCVKQTQLNRYEKAKLRVYIKEVCLMLAEEELLCLSDIKEDIEKYTEKFRLILNHHYGPSIFFELICVNHYLMKKYIRIVYPIKNNREEK